MIRINRQHLMRDISNNNRDKRHDPKDLPETNPENLPIGDEDMNDKPKPPIEDRPSIRHYTGLGLMF